jgi:DNA-binding transcriptional LysR family regulator
MLYAHRSYVKRRGMPHSLADLARHDIIGYDTELRALEAFTAQGLPASRDVFALRTDNQIAQLALLRAGAGIGGMQRQLALREKELLPVLHGAVRIPLEMWLVMHEDLRASRRVRVAYDFLGEALTAYARGR